MSTDLKEHLWFLRACLVHANRAYRRQWETELEHENRLKELYSDGSLRFEFKLKENGSEAVVVSDPERRELFIAFRGTELTRLPRFTWSIWWVISFLTSYIRSDAADDLFARMVNDPDLPGMVHAGFLRHSSKLTKDVIRIAKQFEGFDVYIIGHSLGGAVATRIAGILASKTNTCVAGLVTFGAPPVGDSEWTEYVQQVIGTERIHRVVNCGDAVPRLKTQMLTSWIQRHPIKHVCGLEYLDRSGGVETKIGWLEAMADRIADRWTNPVRKTSGITDHSLDAYCDRLIKCTDAAGVL